MTTVMSVIRASFPDGRGPQSTKKLQPSPSPQPRAWYVFYVGLGLDVAQYIESHRSEATTYTVIETNHSGRICVYGPMVPCLWLKVLLRRHIPLVKAGGCQHPGMRRNIPR